MENSVESKRTEQATRKKAYAKPVLIEYGSIAKLTQGTAGSGADGLSGMARRML